MRKINLKHISFLIRNWITVLIIFININELNAQVSPSLTVSLGLSTPAGEMGGNLVSVSDSGISNISPTFLTDNYGNSTGVTITGSLTIPFEKKAIISALVSGAYTYFNIFRKTEYGAAQQENTTVPVSYDSRFSITTAGFGIELKPIPLSKISPFINSSFTLNILSLSLVKNNYDYAYFNDAFRMGLNTFAGFSYRINYEYSIEIAGSYHMSNLFLKSSDGSYESRAEFGRENIPINDEGGEFYSGLQTNGSIAVIEKGSKKNADWWNINIGVNIVLGKTGKK